MTKPVNNQFFFISVQAHEEEEDEEVGGSDSTHEFVSLTWDMVLTFSRTPNDTFSIEGQFSKIFTFP